MLMKRVNIYKRASHRSLSSMYPGVLPGMAEKEFAAYFDGELVGIVPGTVQRSAEGKG